MPPVVVGRQFLIWRAAPLRSCTQRKGPCAGVSPGGRKRVEPAAVTSQNRPRWAPTPTHGPCGASCCAPPRLELRPDDDTGLLELIDVAPGGIHDPGRTPFPQRGPTCRPTSSVRTRSCTSGRSAPPSPRSGRPSASSRRRRGRGDAGPSPPSTSPPCRRSAPGRGWVEFTRAAASASRCGRGGGRASRARHAADVRAAGLGAAGRRSRGLSAPAGRLRRRRVAPGISRGRRRRRCRTGWVARPGPGPSWRGSPTPRQSSRTAAPGARCRSSAPSRPASIVDAEQVLDVVAELVVCGEVPELVNRAVERARRRMWRCRTRCSPTR